VKIISHRGFWDKATEMNSVQSFIKSFELGFGTETDVRDLNGRIVISHDIALLTSETIYFEDFLEIYKKYSTIANSLPIAINIKADGLQTLITQKLEEYSIDNYFLFDMSFPDQLHYLKSASRVFTRQSEYEKEPLLYKESDGVWLDSFYSNWFSYELIQNHIDNGKIVCIVSSELHKRDYHGQWKFLKKGNLHLENNLILCTDFPEIAKTYFYNG
jgi:glycerophosphoryl diester phosphodiesterase